MAVLRSLNGEHDFQICENKTVIGRDPHCDLVVHNGQVSRQHAIVFIEGDDYFLEDLDSANGTYLNGKRIHEPQKLSPHDRIEVFDVGFQFFLDDSAVSGIAVDDDFDPRTLEQGTILSSLDVSLGADLRFQVDASAKLRAVLEISRDLASSLDLDEVFPRILGSLFSIFPQADRGFILRRNAETGRLVPKAVRFRDPNEENAPPMSASIVRYAMETKKAILSGDAAHDPRFDPTQSIQRLKIRSIMCVPMISEEGEVLGVIHLDTMEQRKQFSQEDLDVLVTASSHAARAVELAQLHEERRDLDSATEIQRSFLPTAPPEHESLEFFEHYSSALQVGGDYYDYIPLPGNRLAIALGDVSGKGFAAALLMARLSSAVRYCLATEPGLPEAVQELNRLLTTSGNCDRFITFVVIVLDLNDFSMTVVNAGHMPPLLRQAKKAEVIDLGEDLLGLPLGILDRPYRQLQQQLDPGDMLVLYTDGVNETRNPAGKLYGADRLRDVMKPDYPDVKHLGQAMLDDVNKFAADRPQGDDRALVCFSRTR